MFPQFGLRPSIRDATAGIDLPYRRVNISENIVLVDHLVVLGDIENDC